MKHGIWIRPNHRRDRGGTWKGAIAGGTAVLSAVWITSCYDFGSLSPPGENGPGGSSNDAEPPTTDGSPFDATTFDSGSVLEDAHVSDGQGDSDTPPILPCPTGQTGRGPTMVGVKAKDGTTYCIDSTEVTRGQYARFLEAAPAQSHLCAELNPNLVPSRLWPTAEGRTPEHPVTYVDWCDAQTFCGWAGKNLCSDTTWRTACTHGDDGAHTYPYGPDYQPLNCNGKDQARAAPTAVAASRTCVGGFPGLFDMSGNVNEWVDSCVTSYRTDCAVRGGSFNDTGSRLRCSESVLVPRQGTSDEIGFRCCGAEP